MVTAVGAAAIRYASRYVGGSAPTRKASEPERHKRMDNRRPLSATMQRSTQSFAVTSPVSVYAMIIIISITCLGLFGSAANSESAALKSMKIEDLPLSELPQLLRSHVRTAIRVWREFVKDSKNGVDLVYDCLQAYPDAPQVLASLANETGLPEERIREALAPLAVNLLLSYTKVFATARSPRLLRQYVAAMGAFYHEKGIPESEYTMLNTIIDQHVRAKVGQMFTEEEARAPWDVLEAVKKSIFRSKENTVAHRDLPNLPQDVLTNSVPVNNNSTVNSTGSRTYDSEKSNTDSIVNEDKRQLH